MAFKRKVASMDFVDDNFFPSQWDQDSLYNPYNECGFYVQIGNKSPKCIFWIY